MYKTDIRYPGPFPNLLILVTWPNGAIWLVVGLPQFILTVSTVRMRSEDLCQFIANATTARSHGELLERQEIWPLQLNKFSSTQNVGSALTVEVQLLQSKQIGAYAPNKKRPVKRH